MSALAERTLLLLLTDTESLTELAKDGLNPVVLPTPPMREVMTWALTYLGANDKAPSLDIMKERWGPAFEQANYDLDAEIEETMGWAVEDLKQSFVQKEIGNFTRTLAISIGNSTPETRLDTLGERASELSKIYFDLQPRTTRVDLRESGPDLLAEYEQASNSDGIRGMRIGLEAIDIHFGGIWPGELFVLGGPSGTGKSFFADYSAYMEWSRGRNTALFTLENSILMTQMRIACMALGMDIENLQTGSLPEATVARLREWCNDVLLASDTPLHIINPDLVGRSPQAVVTLAKALEAESLVVDQLTHLSAVDPSNREGRRDEVSSIVRMLGDQISTGRNRLPCLLLHQINREGIKRAAATGRLLMTDFAETSEVERSASAACSLYASADHMNNQQMQWQTLKARRVKPKHWDLNWEPWNGMIQVANETDFTGVLGQPDDGES